MRSFVVLVVVALAAAGCAASSDPGDVGPLPDITPDLAQQMLVSSTQPVLLNVWASWCIPCRSEAPLLREAHASLGDQVRFIGVNIRDAQRSARSFINEFDLDGFEHFFDASGAGPAHWEAGEYRTRSSSLQVVS